MDGEGRIYSAGPGGSQLASTVYNSASEPTIVTFASLDSDSFTYDPNTFRMAQYKYSVGATPKTVVGDLTWNANGTLGSLGITDQFNAANTQSCTYSYDDLARIASGNCGSVWSQTFSYDAFGNITKSGSMQFQPGYNLNNQMTNGTSYNSTGDVLNDGLHSYGWDVYNRPTTIDAVTVTYDAFGRLVEQTKAGVSTEMEYSPTGFKMQLLSGQSFSKAFVPMPGGTEEVWQSSGASPYYRHADWLGSSRFASTASRTMYNDLAYAPFGEPYAQSGSTGVTDISFAGNDENTVTNLYDAQFREYGIQGRWPSPDPAGLAAANPANPQSWNRYAYVMNNPLGVTDPTGLAGMICREPDRGSGPFVCPGASGGGSLFAEMESMEEGTFSGTCPLFTSCIVSGQTEFDAIGGAPGTYVEQGSNGSMSFGWDYGLYSTTMNQIDKINTTISTSQANAQTQGEPNPFPNVNVPTTYGWTAQVQDLDNFTIVSGIIPDMLAVQQYQQWFTAAVGTNPSAQILNRYSGYYQVYQNLQARVNQELCAAFGICF